MIKIKGLDKTLKDIADTKKAIIEKEQARLTQDLVAKLKIATPIDTGNARDSWHIQNKNIINDAEYISDLNEGHSPQAPAKFIEKTILSDKNFKTSGFIVNEKG